MKSRMVSLMFLVLIAGCDFSEMMPSADEKFGDQIFKTAVAIIELHHVRSGEFPETLADLEYLGDRDQLWLSAVEYERVDDGHNLFVMRGWIGEPELSLADEYRPGLGIRETNISWNSKK